MRRSLPLILRLNMKIRFKLTARKAQNMYIECQRISDLFRSYSHLRIFSVHFHCRNCDADIVNVTDAVSALPISFLFSVHSFGTQVSCVLLQPNRSRSLSLFPSHSLSMYESVVFVGIFLYFHWVFAFFIVCFFVFYLYFSYIQFTYFEITEKWRGGEKKMQTKNGAKEKNTIFFLELPKFLTLFFLHSYHGVVTTANANVASATSRQWDPMANVNTDLSSIELFH